ncbi:MAG: class I SAM-dependent methyltransferase, partial [Arenimonas sp.]
MTSSVLLPTSLWLRSRAHRVADWMRKDEAARARAQLRRELDSGTLAVERLAACPGCGTSRRPWLLATVERMAIPHRTVLCRDCGLSYSSPRMTPAALDAFYRGLYWRLTDPGAVLQNTSERFVRGESILAWTRERIPAGGLVVELGCGRGYNLVPFQRAGFSAIGYEPDAQCATFAREQFQLDVRTGGLDELVASGVGADLLVVSHVIEHMTDPRQSLARARSALAPGGALYVEAPGLLNLDQPTYAGSLLRYLQVAH